MSTPDDTVDPLAEGYHTLAAIHHQWDKHAAQLKTLIGQIDQESKDVLAQQEQAEADGDQETAEKLKARYTDLHRAYAVAQTELEKHPDHHPAPGPDPSPIGQSPEEDEPTTDDPAPEGAPQED